MGRCYYHIEPDGTKFLIPGCYGSMYKEDMSGCTCYKPKMKKEKKEEKYIDTLEANCRLLEAQNEKLNKQNKELREENALLRYRGLPLDIKRKIENINDDDPYHLWSIIRNFNKHKQIYVNNQGNKRVNKKCG